MKDPGPVQTTTNDKSLNYTNSSIKFATDPNYDYSNEAKAMKVLDMIQKEIIDSNFSYNGVTCSTKPMVRVFQMPSDDEVE